jgi:tetratricopeptide (TPR) repeat protein
MQDRVSHTRQPTDNARIIAALGEGNIAFAEDRVRGLLNAHPDDANAQYLFGLVQLVKGKAADSLPWLEKAYQQQPENVVYRSNLGIACLRAGRLADAIGHLQAAVAQKPDYTGARYNLGCALLEDGQAGPAEDCFRMLAEQQPGNADYVCALGDTARELRDWQRAVQCYRKAIRLSADCSRAHINLAPILMHAGHLEEAEALARRAMELEPGQISACKTLGDCLARQERFEEAMDAYADAHDIDPESAVLCAAIGDLWLETGDQAEATAWYQKAIRLNADNINAHCGLARIVRENGNAEQSLEMLTPLLEDSPDNPDLHLALGNTFWDDGDAEAALHHFRTALALQPEQVSLHARIAQVLSSSGCTEQAIAEHRRALEENPACIASLDGLAVSLRDRLEPEHAQTMERLLANDRLRADARGSLHNGLAFYHDGIGSYETAAQHMQLANRCQWQSRSRRGWHYDPEQYADYVSALIATFDRDYFERIGGPGNPDRTPVYIVGMPRSGTTLTEQILARHAAVLGIGERNFAGQTFHAFTQSTGDMDAACLACFRQPDAARIAGLAGAYLGRLHDLKQKAGKPGAVRVVDKLPDNYSLLGWILTLFPNARIIHCRRDPRAVALSCWMTRFGSIRWACHERHLVERIRQYRRLMDHWRRVIPGRFIELDYEALVANQEAESRRLVDWIGLDWDENCLAFYDSDRLVRTASITQVREPIYQRSLEKWKAYEPYLADLLDPLTAMLGGQPAETE